MRLAWKNIVNDRVRFATTVLGISFAVFLMIFLGSLLFGFIRASSKVVDSTDADLWITARGVTCFDFTAQTPRRIEVLAQGVDGVAGVNRLLVDFTMYRVPDGTHRLVALIGADPGVGAGFPLPRTAGGAVEPDTLLMDESDFGLLKVKSLPVEVEINGRRATILGSTRGFSSFIGCPYLFTTYQNALRYSRLPVDTGMNLLLTIAPGRVPEEVKRRLQETFPEVDVWTRQEFSERSSRFWVLQTGAGGGILVAALLGFIIGTVIVSQQIYATTMENIDEFATLKAMGASRWFIVRVLVAQATICGVVGCAVGVAAALPLVERAQQFIAWIYTPWWLPAAMVPPSLLMCALAAIVSVRAALSVDPGRVFRA
jgi:putative ABC transport system permease protein